MNEQTEKTSRGRTIAYWVITVLLCLSLFSGGVADILRIPDVVKGMALLGYPTYFCVIIGVWKVLGTAALLTPRLPLLKEWAYAGAFFDLTGAVISHLATGAGVDKTIAPLILAGMVIASWYLRPASRKL